jgi:hypothetical protein
MILSAVVLPGASSREESIIRGVDQAEAHRGNTILGYTVHEHYSLFRNSSTTPAAEMSIETAYAKGRGKTFSVKSRSGSRVMQSVLDRIIREEEQLSRPGNREHVLMTTANYTMKVVGEETVRGRPCIVIAISARAKKPYLLNGRAWVDARDYYLVRIEGKPTASPSFLAGTPTISREYDRVAGVAMAVRSRAVSSTFLFGRTDIVIDYSAYQLTTAAE